MKILIDCRYLGMSGIGRVCEGLVENLDKTAADFYFLGNTSKLNHLGIQDHIIADDTSPVSKKGMLANKKINEFDVFFIPNFIIPFGVKIPCYTLIHDMMFIDFEGATNGFVDKKIKSFFYKRAMKKSKKIFTVSQFTKKRIEAIYPKCKKEIIVAYNGLSKNILEYKKTMTDKEKKKQIVFVGNVKKQKGLETLLKAMEKVDYDLYIVGRSDKFRTSAEIDSKYFDNPKIKFTGFVPDKEMFDLIASSSYLVQPSLYEGFGIPPLEAMVLNTKPIISDIEVFQEVYEGLDVEFFKAGDEKSLAEVINKNSDTHVQLKEETYQKYSFRKQAEVIFGNILK